MTGTRVVEVVDGVHAVLGSGGMPNAAFIVTNRDVVCVDTRYTPMHAREMLREIRAVTPSVVQLVVNTHHHADHVFGNAVMPADRIVAHAAARERLLTLGDGYVEQIREARPDLADALVDATVRLPTETFTRDLHLHFDDLTVSMTHHGRTAHTSGDLVVHVPERRVLLVGDLVFNGVMPVIRDGDIEGLRATLQELRDLPDVEAVVPGHGELGGPELLDQQLAVIAAITEVIHDVLDDGGDDHAAAQAVVDRFPELIAVQGRAAQWVEKVRAR